MRSSQHLEENVINLIDAMGRRLKASSFDFLAHFHALSVSQMAFCELALCLKLETTFPTTESEKAKRRRKRCSANELGVCAREIQVSKHSPRRG